MSKLVSLVASLGLAACAPIAGDIGAGGTVVAATPAPAPGWGGAPDLMWAAPGVQVVAGWDQPVFFVDNSWWWWNDNGWMWWGPGGWAWAQPPVILTTQIRDPWRFRGWGATGQTRWAGNGRGWTNGGPAVRDHRTGGWTAPARGNGGGGVWTAPTRGNGGAAWGGGRSFGGGGRSFGGGAPTVRDHRRR